MPQSLDEHTRSVIVKSIGAALTILGSANYMAQRVVIPRLRKRSGQTQWLGPPLARGCLSTLCFMLVFSALLAAPIIYSGTFTDQQQEGDYSSSSSNSKSIGDSDINSITDDSSSYSYTKHSIQQLHLTSSINFCENDFQDGHWIAETVNTVSSLASYCPLALWGFFGSPSKEWSTRVTGHRRFAVAYGTLFTIGIGSTLLHAFLTAGAQGGDELPMLWFTASLSFMGLDIILQRTRINLSALLSTLLFGKDPNRAEKEGRWFLHWLMSGSAVIATAIYCFSRENFLPFYIMFVLYSTTATVGLIVMSFLLQWNDISFRSNVLLPLSVCTGWTAILAIVCWVSEMLYCDTAREESSHPIVRWMFNRAIHAGWHCASALLAWLLIQAFLAGQGLQCGWGDPSLHCSPIIGVPYVSFVIQEPSVAISRKVMKQS